MPGENAVEGEQAPVGGTMQGIILEHELAEVLLLLDHISSVKAKSIPAVLKDEPIFGDEAAQLQHNWIEQICEIAWPPPPPDASDGRMRLLARDAAKLLRAKDILNGEAAPATGETIAFTVLMTEVSGPSWWHRLWRALARKRDDEAEADGAHARSRANLAMVAYPHLKRAAPFYKGALLTLLGFLILWLGVTCLLSWDVATGSALLNRYNTLEARIIDLRKAELVGRGDAPRPVPSATPTAGASPEAEPTPGSAASKVDKNDIERAVEQQEIAARNLRQWLDQDGGVRNFLIARMGGYGQVRVVVPPPGETFDIAADVQRNNGYIEWAATALGILAGTILPIFYGLIGAGAATVRIVSAKMRDSILLPRDVVLAYVRLALGAVIGACIGLFVAPDGGPDHESTLLGPVHLSASALCFVAGFGVEGVFQSLEELVRRVFNLDPQRTPTPGNSARP
jgi:hypothetical protein